MTLLPDGYAWRFPVDQGKAHVFRNGVSLCGKFTGRHPYTRGQGIGTNPGPQDCPLCHQRMRAALRAAEKTR